MNKKIKKLKKQLKEAKAERAFDKMIAKKQEECDIQRISSRQKLCNRGQFLACLEASKAHRNTKAKKALASMKNGYLGHDVETKKSFKEKKVDIDEWKKKHSC